MQQNLYPEEPEHLIKLAIAWARERGMSFPLPALVREVHHPVTHWEVLAAPEGEHRTCVLIDPCSQLLNVEQRRVESVAAKVPWWRRLLGLDSPPG